MAHRGTRAMVTGALGLLAAGALVPTAAGAAPPAPHQVPVMAAPRVPSGSTRLGALPAAQAITVGVFVEPRDPAALSAFVAAVSDPGSPQFHQYLAPGQFAQRFGATGATIGAVEDLLRQGGLRIQGVSANRLEVTATGSASALEGTFHTGLERYRLADGSVGRAATGPATVASTVSSSVVAVTGLNDLVHPMAMDQTPRALSSPPTAGAPTSPPASAPAGITGAPSACPAVTDVTEDTPFITQDVVAEAYGAEGPHGLYDAGDLGAGQTVAVYELEPFEVSDVSAFDECYFGEDNTSNISVTDVDGGPGTGSGSGESALDIENISALAPQAQIHVYQAPNTNYGALDNYNQIVSDDTAKVVTTSWGLCETDLQESAPGSQQAENLIFEQAAAQGQSVFAAAGDSGSDGCGLDNPPTAEPPYQSVDDPASQPDVVGVGGTTAASPATDVSDQKVWNDGELGGGGGGGLSDSWPTPPWQANTSVPGADNSYEEASACGTSYCRQVPDVTAFADEDTGITIYWSGPGGTGWYTIGGTSSAAPIWAALLAEINASAACSGGGVGFVSPLLYSVASDPSSYADSFTDVTSGNNDVFGMNGGAFPATTGYDMASGLGSPLVTGPSPGVGLAASLCAAASGADGTQPTVSGLSPGSGPTGGGTVVTVTGTGFEGTGLGTATGVTFGTQAAAAFTVDSATSITVTAPAGSPGPALVTVGFDGGTSRPLGTGQAIFEYLGTAVPGLTSVGPTGGPVAGGNTVDIDGSDFIGTTKVTFGGVEASSFTVVNWFHIRAVVPPVSDATSCAAGSVATGTCQVQVAVTNANGTSPPATILPAASGTFSYQQGVITPSPGCGCETEPAVTEYDYAATPTVSSASPAYGNASNHGAGTTVAVTGSGFNVLTFDWVDLGDPALASSQNTDLVSISAGGTSLRIVADPDPNGVASEADPAALSVRTLGGMSGSVPWAYAALPSVTGVSPGSVPAAGGQVLTVSGRGFLGATSVVFARQGAGSSLSAGSFTVDGDGTVSAVSPGAAAGTYDVEVCTATGCSSPGGAAAVTLNAAVPPPPAPDTSSYSMAGADGAVFTFGGSPFFGSMGGTKLNKPVVAMARTPDGQGYWLVASDGGIFSFGDATFYGSTGNLTLNKPIVGMAATPDGRGYWLAASDGGIFAFGDAAFYGSTGAITLNKPIVAMAPTPDGRGYWLVASDGGIFSFGDAAFYGSTGAITLNKPIVAMAPTPDGRGYWLAASDGGIFSFGDAAFYGSTGNLTLNKPIVAMASTGDGAGYWLVASDGGVFSFGDAGFSGSTGSLSLAAPIVSVTAP